MFFIRKYRSKKLINKLINKLLSDETASERYFIQIGSGAGDLDPRSNYRDGFTEIIKNLSLSQNEKIILVEPNPFNIENLNLCWQDFQNSEIFSLCISEKSFANKSLKFYYTEQDAPHYQVASLNFNHVLKHYNNLTKNDLKTIEVPSVDLKSFILNSTKGKQIILLSLDIEGIDAEILLDTDFSDINMSLLSFEYLHLGDKIKLVEDHLKRCGFEYVGLGVDHNGYDHLYKKKIKDDHAQPHSVSE